MSEETLVYLFTGFMDAGKTSMIKETLFINGFAKECGNFLIVCCEDGEEEYDIDKIKSYGANLVTIEEEEDFTLETLQGFENEDHPDAEKTWCYSGAGQSDSQSGSRRSGGVLRYGSEGRRGD